jgi:inorganic pyrophosphatase
MRSRALLVCALFLQLPAAAPRTLPETAVAKLAQSIDAAEPHAAHTWRDTPATNPDGTLNAYVEIPRGDRRKREYDMRRNDLALDRIMPEEVGGYPVNYGFVPQTISYDGDPFDVLVLGPPIPAGTLVRGLIVALMLMDDEKGLDSKVVISRADATGTAVEGLRPDDRRRIAGFFNRYKMHEPGAFSRVTGWGSAAAGRSFVEVTHAFFRECLRTRAPCTLRAR